MRQVSAERVQQFAETVYNSQRFNRDECTRRVLCSSASGIRVERDHYESDRVSRPNVNHRENIYGSREVPLFPSYRVTS